MTLPPMVLSLRMGKRGRFRIWLPLFLLWPLVLVSGVVLLPILLLLTLVLWPFERTRIAVRAAPGLIRVAWRSRGLKLDVRDSGGDGVYFALR